MEINKLCCAKSFKLQKTTFTPWAVVPSSYNAIDTIVLITTKRITKSHFIQDRLTRTLHRHSHTRDLRHY